MATPRQAHRDSVPARRRFALHEVGHVPVHIGPRAQAFLHTTTTEGRAFPQALSEIFGELEGLVTDIRLNLVPKARHFPCVAEDVHPLSGQETHLLAVTARHQSRTLHTWYLNAGHLLDFDARRMPLFSAEDMARELVRLYAEDQSLHNGREEEEDAL